MSWKKWLEDKVSGNEEVVAMLSSSLEEQEQYRLILECFPMSVPKYYLSLIDRSDPDDPIKKMCIPSLAELDITGHFDTSGEGENTVITGMQHKYGATSLVLSTNSCAMYCRHCFRKRLVGLTDEEILCHFDSMIEYIRQHEEMSNVLISGGDAFLNSNAIIERYLSALCEIDHLDFIRFGTRTPVVLPQRIYEDEELLQILKKYQEKKNIYVVTQFNHPRELTPEAKKAINALHSCNIEVKNQTVLLRGINDKPEILAELMRRLTQFNITPYYVFQCRPVSGVGTQFQVPISEGIKIVEAAKTNLGGPAKCFRYAMSHITGKIEILGDLGDGQMLFKYHQAKYLQDTGRLFTQKLSETQAWLEEIPQ